MSWRKVLVIVIAIVAVLAVVYSLFGRSSHPESRDLSRVLEDAQAGRVQRIEVRGDKLTVTLDNGEEYTSRKEEDFSIVETLQREGIELGGSDGIEVSVEGRSALSSWIGLLFAFLPIILIGGGIWFFAFRYGRNRRGQP